MGFPVPLGDWMKDELGDYLFDCFSSESARARPYLDDRFDVRKLIAREGEFTRNLWGLLSLELWQQQFHDCAGHWSTMVAGAEPATVAPTE